MDNNPEEPKKLKPQGLLEEKHQETESNENDFFYKTIHQFFNQTEISILKQTPPPLRSVTPSLLFLTKELYKIAVILKQHPEKPATLNLGSCMILSHGIAPFMETEEKESAFVALNFLLTYCNIDKICLYAQFNPNPDLFLLFQQAVAKSFSINRLEFSFTKIDTPENFSILAEVITATKNLTSLKLCRCFGIFDHENRGQDSINTTDKRLEIIFGAISRNPKLKQLDISLNNIGESFATLATLLPKTNLEIIDLGTNNIDLNESNQKLMLQIVESSNLREIHGFDNLPESIKTALEYNKTRLNGELNTELEKILYCKEKEFLKRDVLSLLTTDYLAAKIEEKTWQERTEKTKKARSLTQ